MKNHYKILHIEDSETDAELIEIELTESNIPFDYLLVESREEYTKALDEFCPDVILCDHTLPAFNSFEALRLLKQRKLNIPFIVITATMTEDVAATLVTEGADDYLLKDRLKRMPHVVLNAIDKYRYEKERKQIIDEAFEKEAKTKALLIQLSNKLLLATKSAGMGVWDWNLATGHLDWDDGMYELYNIGKTDFSSVYDGWLSRLHIEDKWRVNKDIETALAGGNPYDTEFRVVWCDASVHHIKATGIIEKNEAGQPIRMIGINQDVTKSKEAEQRLKESEAKYRSFFETSLDGILLSEPDGQLHAANSAACEMFQMTEAELCKVGRQGITDNADPRLKAALEERRRTGSVKAEITGIRKNGNHFPIEISSSIFTDAHERERTAMIIRDITERKRTEQEIVTVNNALEHALSELQKIMDSSVDIICTIDEDGKFANVSSAATNILGYKPEELIGKNYINFVYKDDRNETLNMATHILSGKPLTMFENRYIRKDGTIVPVLWSVKWDITDKVMYCVAKDATEKKRMEKALAGERLRFFKLFYQAPLSIGVLKGPDHVYDFANLFYLEFIGKKNIIGKTVKEVLPEVVGQGFIEILDDVYHTGQPFLANEVPVKLNRENNGTLVDTYVNIVYQVYKDNDDKIEGIFFFTIDVTEQVLSRRKIEKSEKQYRQIVETAQEGIWTIDENNKTAFVNQKMCDLLGYTQAEMMGKTNLSFKSPEEQKKAKEQIERRKQGISEMHDTTYVTKSGQIIHAHVSTNPIFADDGIYKGALAMVTDITDRKLAEIERTKLVNDVVMRNKDLEQFTYIVSHNLRAPVANIIGMSRMMVQHDLAAEEKDYICAGIHESVTKLDTVVKDLNHILQIKNSYNEIKETVSFSKLVEDIKLSIRHLLNDTINIQYDFSATDEMVTIKSYLYSTFYNLLTNSIKYRQPGANCLINIKSAITENTVELLFADNGMGIDLQQRGDEVFGLYKRFHANVEGKGIGLFMVKTQLEVINGKISVESEVNKGTTFKIKLDI